MRFAALLLFCFKLQEQLNNADGHFPADVVFLNLIYRFQTTLYARAGTVGGNWRTWRDSTQTQGE